MKKLMLTLFFCLTLNTHSEEQNVSVWSKAKQKFLKLYKSHFKKPILVTVLEIEGGIYDPRPLIKILHSLDLNKTKAILLLIDSPGGSVGASDHLFEELKKLKQKLPIITLVEGWGTSAAYKLATATNKIITTSDSIVGSIGVIHHFEKLKNKKAHYGYLDADVEDIIFKAGSQKAPNYDGNGLTEEQEERTKEELKKTYVRFVESIAKERHLDLNKKEEWADGKTFSGHEALELGLIDKIGSYTEAIEEVIAAIKERGIEVKGKMDFKFPNGTLFLSKQLDANGRII